MTSAPFLLAWQGPGTCLKAPGPLCLHLQYFVFEHTLDFVAHGFSAGIAEMGAHLAGGLADFLYQRGASLLYLFLYLYLWWTNVGQMSAVCPGRGKSLVLKPCRPLSLGLSRGLTNQQFDIAHVEGAAVQHFYKAQLQEDLQGPLHSADLLAGDGGNHLRRVGDILVKLGETMPKSDKGG